MPALCLNECNYCHEWLLNLNISKCKVIAFGRNVDKTHMYKISDKNYNNNKIIERVDTIRDLGILIDLSFKEHIPDKINKAYRMLGLIKRNFKYLTTESFTLLYKNSHKDFAPIQKSEIRGPSQSM